MDDSLPPQNANEQKPAQSNQGGTTPSKGYGKRPLWFWVLIYLIVGGLVYWLVYYFWLGDSSGGSLY